MPCPTLPPKDLWYIYRQDRVKETLLPLEKEGTIKWVGQVRQEARVRARSWNHLSWGQSLISLPKAGSSLIESWPPWVRSPCSAGPATWIQLLAFIFSALLPSLSFPSGLCYNKHQQWKAVRCLLLLENKAPQNSFSVLFNPDSMNSLMPWWRTRLCSVAQKVGRRGRARINPVSCSEQRSQHRAVTARICPAKARESRWKLSPACRQKGWS